MAQRKTIHLIPHAHIDTEWFWTLEETAKRVVAIVESVLDVMRADDAFTFCQDQVTLMEPVLRLLGDEDRAFLRRMIEEERFDIVGGMWVQPDVQVPHAEVLIRNIQQGRRWFREALGVPSEHAWNIDTFGQCPQLPQILSKSGMRSYTFMRGVSESLARELPDLFHWEGPDGSRILTCWMKEGYQSGIHERLLPNSEKRQTELFYRYLRAPFPPKKKDEMSPDEAFEVTRRDLVLRIEGSNAPIKLVPVGDDNFIFHPEVLPVVEELRKRLPDYDIEISTPSAFFAKAEQLPDLPTVKADPCLPLRIVDLRGTFEGRCELKKAQREYELTLLQAEKFSTVARLLGRRYPWSSMRIAWTDAILNSFHDTIGGSHSDEVYQAAMTRYGKARHGGRINETPALALEGALGAIASQIKTYGGSGRPLAVFNGLSWQREDICEFDCENTEQVSIVDEEGKVVAHQTSGDGKAVFHAESVPAIGYKTFYVRRGKVASEEREGVSAGTGTLENRWWRIEFDTQNGGIKRLYDKSAKREILDTSSGPGNEIVALSGDGDLEGMLELDGTEWRSGDGSVSALRAETGPVFGSIAFDGEMETGPLTRRVTIYAAHNRIDFETTVDIQRSKFLMLVDFPLAMRNPEILYETPYATMQRFGENLAAQNWVACQDGDHGVALVNTGNPGYWANENHLRMALLWSVDQVWPPKSYNAPLANEPGEHTFGYSLFPYEGTWQKAGVVQRGNEINNPLLTFPKQAGKGKLPKSKSFLEATPSRFVVSTMKAAENGDGFVIRGYESTGEPADVSLKLGFPVEQAWQADLLEQADHEVSVVDGQLRFHCDGYEIVTVIVR